MEYDFEMMNFQRASNESVLFSNSMAQSRNNESSASSSVSSSENTFLNFFNQTFSNPYIEKSNATTAASRVCQANFVNESEMTVKGNRVTSSGSTCLPNSCSLIFSTAASFNINQQVSLINLLSCFLLVEYYLLSFNLWIFCRILLFMLVSRLDFLPSRLLHTAIIRLFDNYMRMLLTIWLGCGHFLIGKHQST